MIPRQLIFLLAFAPSLAFAQQIVLVDDPGDEDPTTCDPTIVTGCSLRSAVQLANSGVATCNCVASGSGAYDLQITAASVTLLPGAFDNHNQSGDIDIYPLVDLTIEGTSATPTLISGMAGFDDRIFDVHQQAVGGTSITFSNLTLSGGAATTNTSPDCGGAADSGDGGAIRIDYISVESSVCPATDPTNPDSVTLNEVSVGTGVGASNSSAGNGGGIACQGALLALNASPVGFNSAVGGGGGIYSSANDTIVSGSTISHNTAASGAGINIPTGDTADLSLQQSSSVHDNTATGLGGGVFIGSASQATPNAAVVCAATTASPLALCVDSSTIANNAALQGGGIYLAGNAGGQIAYLSHSSVGAAAVTTPVASPASNTATSEGGGIYSVADRVVLNGTSVIGNSAGTFGGGIYTAASSALLAVQLTSHIDGNKANSGGGLYLLNQSAAVSPPPAIDCTLAAGTSANLAVCITETSTVNANLAANQGGGIDLAASGNQIVHIEGQSKIGASGAGNNAQDGAGIYANVCTDCTLAVSGATVRNNVAAISGGGIDNQGYQNININGGAQIVGNQASTTNGLGGGIYSIASAGSAKQALAISGAATNIGTTLAPNSASEGGGLYLDAGTKAATATITNAFVEGNTSTKTGAGIALDHGSGDATYPALSLDTATIDGNVASTNGGGLFQDILAGNVHTSISGSFFYNNKATTRGGAIYNMADGASFSIGASATCGVALTAPSVTLICNTTFGLNGNAAAPNTAGSGGAIANLSSLFLSSDTLANNTATAATTASGGAILNTAAGTLLIYNSELENNSATLGTGGAIATTGNMVMVDSELEHNSAAGDGGGVFSNLAASTTTAVAIIYSTLFDNIAGGAEGGGGVSVSTAGNVLLNNDTLELNAASGGAGGGVFGGNNTKITNTILSGNTSGPTAAPDDCVATKVVSLGYNYFSSASSCTSVASNDLSAITGPVALFAAPQTTRGAPSGGIATPVLPIGPTSVAVNAADGAGGTACGTLITDAAFTGYGGFTLGALPATDQRGVTQPQGSKCDIGAFESTPDEAISVKQAGNATCPSISAGGAVVPFTVSVANNGFTTGTGPSAASDASGTNVIFTFPSAHTVLSAFTPPSNWACSPASTSPITCSYTPATLPAGLATQAFTFSLAADATTPPGSTLAWGASIADDTADPDPSNNNLSGALTACPITDTVLLTVSKTDLQAPGASITAGTPMKYTITVHNAGPSSAIGTTLNDVMPVGGTLMNWSCMAGGASTCGTLTCGTPPCTGLLNGTINVAPAPSSGAATANDVVFTANVSTSLAVTDYSGTDPNFTLNNTATIAAGSGYGAAGSVLSASDNHPVTGPISELGVTKTAPSPVGAGATETFVTTLTVVGPSSSKDITLSDASGSAATTFVSFTPDASGLFVCTGAPAVGASGATNISCVAAGTVPPGVDALHPATYTFTTTMTIADSGTLPPPIPYSAAIATAGDSPPQPPASASSLPDSASGTVTVTSISDAAIAIGAPAAATAGATFTDTITVTNTGPSIAQGLTWNMTTPTGTSFVSIAPSANWTCSAPAAGQAGAISCTITALAAGADPQTFSIVLSVDPTTADGTHIVSTATLGALSGDPDTSNNGPVSAATVVNDSADLQITFVADADSAPPDGAFDYALDIGSSGPSVASQVTVTIALPTGVVAGAVTSANLVCGAADSSNVITCGIASLASGDSETATIAATIAAEATAGTTLTATAVIGSATSDPNPANDSAQASITVTQGNVAGNVSFGGGAPVAASQVRARGGFFSCNSTHGGPNGTFDLSALFGLGWMIFHYRRRR